MQDKMSNELYISSAWPTTLCESVDVGAAEEQQKGWYSEKS